MKRIMILLACCLAGVWTSSCSKYLQETSTTYYDEETVFSTPEALESQLFGVYLGMNQSRLWLGTQHEFLQAGSGLIIWKGQRMTDDWLDQLKFGKYSTTGECNAYLFSQIYTAINRCNRLIDNLPGCPVEQAYKTEVEAEARFVRAIFYFLAVRLWSDVPLILTSPRNFSQMHNPRIAWYKVYAQILDDLTFAEKNMRSKERQEAVNPGKGRPFNTAATAIKASVYLTIGSLLSSPDDNFWDPSRDAERVSAGKDPRTPDFTACGIRNATDAFQLAYDTAKAVMESGAYSLVPNYFKLFTWKDDEDFFLPEGILVVQSSNTAGGSNAAARTLPEWPPYTANVATKNNNWGRVRPDRFYINEFLRRTGGVKGTGEVDSAIYISTEDPRFDATFFYRFNKNDGSGMTVTYPRSAIQSTSTAAAFPYFRKYADPTYDVTPGRAGCYVMRYAEIYLIRAEAAAQLSTGVGDSYWNEAFDLVETLHARARQSFDTWKTSTPGKPAYPHWDQEDFSTKEQLRDAIVWERFIEMAGECHEWFDTHRYGATWLRDNIAVPKNDFLSLECNQITAEYIYFTTRPHPEEVSDIRKGLLCAFPEAEMLQNNAIEASDQNDFYWQ